MMMMLLFVLLRFGLRLVACEPYHTTLPLSLSSFHAPVSSLVFMLVLVVRLSESIRLLYHRHNPMF